MRLDPEATNRSQADFDNDTGSVNLDGGLTLNDENVQSIAYIELNTLEGRRFLMLFEN